MKMTESESQLRQVELDVILREHDLLGQSGEQISAAEKVEDQVQLAFSLKLIIVKQLQVILRRK